jgi:SPP1 gp7 family putative phage head morphogenesis protein
MPRKRVPPRRTRQIRTQSRGREVIIARAELEFLRVWREIERQAYYIVQQWIHSQRTTLDAGLGREWVNQKLRELFAAPRDWRRMFGRMAEQTDDDVLNTLIATVPKVDRRMVIPSRRVDEFAERNAGLIGGLNRVAAERVERFFAKVETGGLHVEAMAERLETEFNVGEARARLWARDQTLKLHANITEERHKAVGITEYIWTTSGDERVRKDHAALDGQTFSYDDPPVVDERTGRRGNPGEDFQCRCTAFPVL